jgi:hypothetical protein
VLTADSIIFDFCLLVVFIVWYRPSLTTGTLRLCILQTCLLTSALIVPRATIKRTSELYIFLALQSRDHFLSVHLSQLDGPFWVIGRDADGPQSVDSRAPQVRKPRPDARHLHKWGSA